MGPEHRQQTWVVLDQCFDRLPPKVVGTLALWVFPPLTFLSLFVVHGVGPEQVAQKSFKRDFDEPVDFLDLFNLFEFRADSAMHR